MQDSGYYRFGDSAQSSMLALSKFVSAAARSSRALEQKPKQSKKVNEEADGMMVSASRHAQGLPDTLLTRRV